MSANSTETTAGASAVIAPATDAASSPGVPKKITNAQTVCNEKNEKGKLCNGHLKQVHTGGEEAEQHLRGDDVLFKCQFCGTLYMGPPLGHVRDPYKQQRFVERELTAILQAAGGTLPAIVKNEKGAFVLAEAQTGHAHAPAKPAATQTPAAAATNDAAQAADTAARQAGPSAAPKTAGQSATSAAPTPAAAKPAAEAKTIAGYVPPPAPGPVPGETPEQKLERLRAIVAEAKRRKTAAEAAAGDQPESATEPQPAPAVQTQPAAADTSGTDSSAQADAHRPAAEAQAATGQASAVPLNPSAANASPAAAEQRADSHGTPGRAAFDTGPVAGETYEQKIARLKLVVNAARELAGKPPKY